MTTIGDYLEQKGNDTEEQNNLRNTLIKPEFGYKMTDNLSRVAEKRAPGLAAKLLDPKYDLSFGIVSGLIEAGDKALVQQLQSGM